MKDITLLTLQLLVFVLLGLCLLYDVVDQCNVYVDDTDIWDSDDDD